MSTQEIFRCIYTCKNTPQVLNNTVFLADILLHTWYRHSWEAACFEAIHPAWLLRSCNFSLLTIHLPTYSLNYTCHSKPLLCGSSSLHWLGDGDPIWFPSFTEVEKCFTTPHLKCTATKLPLLGCLKKFIKKEDD